MIACKTLVFDPGVRGTVVGFPVHPWSCVLLVLRLAGLSFCFCGVAACFVFLLFLCLRCSVELLLVLLGVRGGFSFLSRVCFCFKRVCEHRRPLQHMA